MLDAFQNQGNALANTDAHGAKRVFAFGAQKLIERGGYQARAAGAQWMPDSNGATLSLIHISEPTRPY